jgi:hypothetical protein
MNLSAKNKNSYQFEICGRLEFHFEADLTGNKKFPYVRGNQQSILHGLTSLVVKEAGVPWASN